MIIVLTPVRERTGPSQLLDMVKDRSKQVFKQWHATHPQHWGTGSRLSRWDGFTSFRTAASVELPDAVTVMGPFHVVRPASCALDQYRRRVWRDAFGPARPQMTTRSARARRSLHTGARLLTKRQQTRLEDLFSNQTACQDRSHLGHLPVHGHRQARARPEPWQVRQAIRDRLLRERCPYHARRSVTPRPNP